MIVHMEQAQLIRPFLPSPLSLTTHCGLLDTHDNALISDMFPHSSENTPELLGFLQPSRSAFPPPRRPITPDERPTMLTLPRCSMLRRGPFT